MYVVVFIVIGWELESLAIFLSCKLGQVLSLTFFFPSLLPFSSHPFSSFPSLPFLSHSLSLPPFPSLPSPLFSSIIHLLSFSSPQPLTPFPPSLPQLPVQQGNHRRNDSVLPPYNVLSSCLLQWRRILFIHHKQRPITSSIGHRIPSSQAADLGCTYSFHIQLFLGGWEFMCNWRWWWNG